AIELGGKFSGQEYPDGIDAFTKLAVQGVAGTGLVGVFQDPRHEGTVPGLCVAFCEIELDLETGKYEILDLVNVADSGTIIHPQGMRSLLRGGAVEGISLSTYERHLYDPQNGLPASANYWQSKVPTYMDVPLVT